MPGGNFAPQRPLLQQHIRGALALCILIAPLPVTADWLSDLSVGAELGGNASVGWLLEKQSLPLTQRLSLNHLGQSNGDRNQLTYRAQYNISSSFYHFADVTTGANRAVGIDARQTAVLATANSPYRGRAGLALEAGVGFERIALKTATAERDETQAVLFLGARVSHVIGDNLTAELAHQSLSGVDYADLTTTLSAHWRLYDNITLRLNYRVHQVNFYRHSNISDENILLSIGYRFDWIPTSNRWPDT